MNVYICIFSISLTQKRLLLFCHFCVHTFIQKLGGAYTNPMPERNIETLKPTIDCVKLCYISEGF